MNDYLTNPQKAASDTPVQIARNLWRTRFEMPVGMFRSVEHGFIVSLYRKTNTEFVFMFSGLNRRDFSIVQDAIRENWDEEIIEEDDDE